MRISQVLSAKARVALLMGASMFAAAPAHAVTLNDGSIRLDFISRFDHGGVAAAEIVSYDPTSKRMFVVNGALGTVDIVDISNVNSPTLVTSLNANTLFGPFPANSNAGVNSVSVKNGIVALAIDSKNASTHPTLPNAQNPGKVAFIDTNGALLKLVDVGFLPDMLTFTPDGTKVLVANEAEPNSYGAANSFNPEGSVSVIDLSAGVANASVTSIGFTQFNGQEAALNTSGVRIYGPGATAAQDLEPEYIAVSADGTTAYVSIQEANALMTINLTNNTITSLKSFGLKDHSIAGFGLDASDRDGPGTGGASLGLKNITTWPIKGMYMPDAIATYQVNGQTFIVTANEGDARTSGDFPGVNEEVSLGSAGYVLDPAVFSPAMIALLKSEDGAGRLNVSNASGNLDGDAAFEEIHAFGARSFSIFDVSGNLVFDSGDQFEQITSEVFPTFFNASHDNQNFDNRSDNKGPEPESVVVAELEGRILAFIGLERIGGVMIFDITDPANAKFINYANSREFFLPFNAQNHGDLGLEGLFFISAADSPNGHALLITANEVSGTTAIFQINQIPEPATGLLGLAWLAALAARRRRA